MTHSRGIPVCQELADAFNDIRLGNSFRSVKIQIINETLVESGRLGQTDSVENDWAAFQATLEPKIACYIAFRLESRNEHGDEWVLISYVPDGSPVKERMLYASTRDLLKRQLGYSYFLDELHGSSPDDVSWEMYKQHDRKKGVGDAPLTEAEIQVSAASRMEIDHGHTREYVHSVMFPMSAQAVQALKNLSGGAQNLVQLRIDPDRETIELRQATNASGDSLGNEIPTDEPCFSFFRWDHQFEGANLSPVVFLYSCAESSKVKLKMLYSTVKAAAADAASQQGIEISKKFEITEGADVSEEFFQNEFHPAAAEAKKAMKRPTKPGRGPSRITRRT